MSMVDPMRFDPTALEIARICGQCDGMPDWPHVTVIVPVWNGQDMITGCLTALERQDYPSFDIIVVDNGSDDATVEIVRGFASVQLLHEPIVSSYAARNRGVASATGSYIAFTDADCIPEPGWLSAGMAVARAHPEAAIIGGHVDIFRPPDGSAVATAYERLFAFGQDRTLAAGRCATANWLSPTVVLKRFGGFDASLRSGGDFQLSKRMHEAGEAMTHAPDMIVRHPGRPDILALAARRRRISSGSWQAHRGIMRRLHYLGMTPVGILRDLRRAAAASDLTVAMRFSVAGIVIRLGAVQFTQSLRMLLGASPPRS